MIAARRSDGFFNYSQQINHNPVFEVSWRREEGEGGGRREEASCVFRFYFYGKKRRAGLSLPSSFSSTAKAIRIKVGKVRECDRDELTDGCALVYRRLCRCTTLVGAAAINRPRKTPLFDYSSMVAKEKPQVQGLSRNDFRG